MRGVLICLRAKQTISRAQNIDRRRARPGQQIEMKIKDQVQNFWRQTQKTSFDLVFRSKASLTEAKIGSKIMSNVPQQLVYQVK